MLVECISAISPINRGALAATAAGETNLEKVYYCVIAPNRVQDNNMTNVILLIVSPAWDCSE
jgi:hypothetical protein